jgi:cell division protein FtsN
MDVGYFISELLAQHGDVSVPGLGYFARTRVNGHYNDGEGKLYPPGYSVEFNPQSIEDDTLAQYIVDKKNISLASSKYFTEKFVNNIKLQAQAAEAALGNLGWFYTQGEHLYFKPNTALDTDPDFFGYQPLSLHKIGAAPVAITATIPPVEEKTVTPVTIPQKQDQTNGNQYQTDEEHEAYLVESAHKKKRNSTIVFVLLAILLTALVVYLVDRYDPSVFNLEAPKPKVTKTEPVINARVEQPADTNAAAKETANTNYKPDSVKAAAVKPPTDSVAKTPVGENNIITGTRYEVMGGSFKDLKEANKAIANYKKLGVEARIVEDAPGRRVKVTLGTFKTRAESEAARKELLKQKKVSKDIYSLEIKPKTP